MQGARLLPVVRDASYGGHGLLFEVDVQSLACKQLANLVLALALPKGAQPHFKAAFRAQGRLVTGCGRSRPVW